MMGGNEVNSFGANALSATADTEIIPQELQKGNPKNRLMINIYGSAGVGKTTFAKKLQDFIVEYQKENLKYNKLEPQFNPALVGEYATMLINDSKFDELGKEIAEAEAELKDENLLDEVDFVAVKRILAYQLKEEMKAKKSQKQKWQ
ncbi:MULTISPECIES: ATP-binding protein [unclassified Campylobacter]|uniref:ATP-binding protein n=2 Tax=unclassified Campylobacter TaxID=2593542 RepID=UPI0022E9974D|nr:MULTISPECIES: ATP-binding protein [unclassified Campylobacter]MDA3048226.1 ATP-binding protein [Campylobacter sp. JMF_08 NE1]MDA3055015.1 ATP-binding protein [Campylobacter sp. VBCF_07 NA4]MDA3060517.1 ATP-binding protein [Campylobacter sp. VBCF_02 NA5]MDA3070217.1 ATP-binding protein [Campylobacter sp. VBCF_08 NA3]